MEYKSDYSQEDIKMGTRALKVLMAQRVLHKVSEIDARSLTVLQKNDLAKKAARIDLPSLAIGALRDAHHSERVNVVPGPMLFLRVEGDDHRLNALDAVDFLFSPERDVRAAAFSHFDRLQNSDVRLITKRTVMAMAVHREMLISDDPEQWRTAAVTMADAVRDDFFCNLAGLRQSMITRLDEGMRDYLPKILVPSVSSLDAVELAVSKPSDQQKDIENIIRECISDSASLSDACSLYYRKLGHLPLSNRLSLGQLVVEWMNQHESDDMQLEDLWAWAEELPSPLPRYHICVALAALFNRLSEQQVLRLFDEIGAIICVSSGGAPENGSSARWLLWCKLATHYAWHLECHLPQQDGERICNLAWWLTEQVAPVLSPTTDSAATSLAETVEPAAIRSGMVWQVTNPIIAPSSLRYATLNLRTPWSTALGCSIGDSLVELSRKGMPDDLKKAVTEAFSAYLFTVFPLPQDAEGRPVYAFDQGIISIVEAWASTLADSDQKTLLVQLVSEYLQIVEPGEIVKRLRDIAIKNESEQLLTAVALKVMAHMDRIAADDVWNCVGNVDWCKEVLLKADINALGMISDALEQLLVRSGEPWRSQLPHFYAYGCEWSSGDLERHRMLFASTVISSMNVDTVSAIDRLLKGQQSDEFLEDVAYWVPLLREVARTSPAWVSDRIRATLASLHT